MKIVNGGRPCDDVSTVKEIGLNYCSRVICAAKGYTPEVESGSKPASGFESQLLIKLDGSKSVHSLHTDDDMAATEDQHSCGVGLRS
mgnify:CR=1 FL=1